MIWVSKNKLALAHDFLTVWGGAERVFRVMAEMYPEAPIYTLFYDEAFVQQYFPGREIKTSFLQKLPRFIRHSRFAMLLYPVAVETLDLRDFDTVLSSSGAWMKGLVTRLHTRHIAYLHSPMRYVWDTSHTHPELRRGAKLLKRLAMNYLRLWDREAADRPDILLVNSKYTEERVAKYYRRTATVIYPPVSLGTTVPAIVPRETKQTFLVVGRLSASKHIDLIVEAFNKLGLPLVVVGAGSEERRLRKIAAPHITFRGLVSETELILLYSEARALIQASEEDFGLVAAEALSLGTPVIAFAEGAASEVVVPGKTGELFDDLAPEAIADGVRRFLEEGAHYERATLLAAGQQFSLQSFQQAIRDQVNL